MIKLKLKRENGIYLVTSQEKWGEAVYKALSIGLAYMIIEALRHQITVRRVPVKPLGYDNRAQFCHSHSKLEFR